MLALTIGSCITGLLLFLTKKRLTPESLAAQQGLSAEDEADVDISNIKFS